MLAVILVVTSVWHPGLGGVDPMYSTSTQENPNKPMDLIHQHVQVPRMEVLNLIFGYLGASFRLLSHIHTADVGEDSSSLGTWNVWWLMVTSVGCHSVGPSFDYVPELNPLHSDLVALLDPRALAPARLYPGKLTFWTWKSTCFKKEHHKFQNLSWLFFSSSRWFSHSTLVILVAPMTWCIGDVLSHRKRKKKHRIKMCFKKKSGKRGNSLRFCKTRQFPMAAFGTVPDTSHRSWFHWKTGVSPNLVAIHSFFHNQKNAPNFSTEGSPAVRWKCFLWQIDIWQCLTGKNHAFESSLNFYMAFFWS